MINETKIVNSVLLSTLQSKIQGRKAHIIKLVIIIIRKIELAVQFNS